MKTGEAGETLLRILQAQLLDQVEIGLDGAPTGQQVEHWERHQDWPRDTCRFCIAEGRINGKALGQGRRQAKLVVKRQDGVEIKRLHESLRGDKAPQIASKSAKELGL